MSLKISVITLAADDLDAAVAFYRDGMSLPAQGQLEGHDHVEFSMAEGVSLVLFPRTILATYADESTLKHSSTEIILTLMVEDEAAANALIQRAEAAGAIVTRQAQREEWGYVGYFKSPDGHVWEILAG